MGSRWSLHGGWNLSMCPPDVWSLELDIPDVWNVCRTLWFGMVTSSFHWVLVVEKFGGLVVLNLCCLVIYLS